MTNQDQQTSTREQMVEKAARASHQYGYDCGAEYAGWDELTRTVRQQYRSDAAAILDAVLPQVWTFEELQELDGDVLLTSSDGEAWRTFRTQDGRIEAHWANQRTQKMNLTDMDWPLTVVWTPPTT